VTRASILATLMLFGCAQPAHQQTTWKKEGATDTEYQADSYTCEKDARQSGYFGTGLIGAVSVKNFVEHCMFAHGWHLEDMPQSKPFTAEEWDQVTSYCRSHAESVSHNGEDSFPVAYNSCMAARGF
jgi:hypothetical protein